MSIIRAVSWIWLSSLSLVEAGEKRRFISTCCATTVKNLVSLCVFALCECRSTQASLRPARTPWPAQRSRATLFPWSSFQLERRCLASQSPGESLQGNPASILRLSNCKPCWNQILFCFMNISVTDERWKSRLNEITHWLSVAQLLLESGLELISLPSEAVKTSTCLVPSHSDVHMYMGQQPVYTSAPGSMAPADIQSYQNPAGGPGPGPAPGSTPAGMTQTANYSSGSGPSIAPSSDVPQAPYSEKALL